MRNKKLSKLAKVLFKNSLTNSEVDELKVKKILSHITSQKILGVKTLLKYYKRLIENALAREEIIIEIAQLDQIKELEKQILTKTKAKRISYKINPSIVFGTKITHGDWVYDSTLEAKLNNLIK